MKHYFCIILLTFGANGQNLDYIEVTASSGGIVENVPDQNTAGDDINTNYYGGNGELDYYGDNYGNKYNGKYFAKDVEYFLFNRKLSDVETLQRSRGLYEHYEYDDGNPDVHGRIQRPCQAYDTFCIRRFFAQHSQCNISGRQVPEPLFRAQATLNIPNTNVSATFNNVEYRGIKDGRVAEFYVNRQTDKVVVTIEFTNLTMRSRDTFLRYHRRAREPIITYGYTVIEYPSILLTVTIPQVNDLLFEKSDNFAYANAIPKVDMDPRLGESSDPVVPNTFAFMRANLATFATEALLTQSQFFSTVFIQKVICDFGIKVALA
ncbi:uncharacterized protein LOC134654602 [Cydia amplana]|uniref:uncharacterized protein LOC134654602 n=1 Tax=Cydia amplana TaxID=1869771 RepID=UPI002FE5B27B